MPTTDLTPNVFSGSAGDGARRWGEVEGGALVAFTADAQLRRGINLDLGLEALASLEGSFRRYLAAELKAEARGTLRLRGRSKRHSTSSRRSVQPCACKPRRSSPPEPR